MSNPSPPWIPADKQMPQPWLITVALDSRQLFDPELSREMGVEIGAIDRWEQGIEVPTVEQMQHLSEVTHYPLHFFYRTEQPNLGSSWGCGKDGCDLYEDTFVELWRGRWMLDRERPDAYIGKHRILWPCRSRP